MKNVVEAINLTKIYHGGIKAVDDISFNIEEGEMFGFLGPNGAGKTTTIMMLITLINPTSGTARIFGHDIKAERNTVRNYIGYVSQDVAVDDQLTGRENIQLQGRFYHVPKKILKERVEEVLNLLDLEDRAKDKVETYSGGMRKRLDIAAGLIHRPEVLFLDEPTLGLDIQTREKIHEYIKILQEEKNMTIFITTHYMEEADKLCDRVVIIDHGKIKALDKPEKLKGDVGGDIITFKITSESKENVQNTLAEIQKQSFFLNMIEPEKKSNNGRSSQDSVSKDTTNKTNVFNVVVRDGATAIPQVFKIASDIGSVIESIAVKRPTLDDVFLSFTGRALREEEGSRMEHMVQARRMRRVRQ